MREIAKKLVFLLCTFLSLRAQVQNKDQDWMTWDGDRVVVVERTDFRVLRIESREAHGARSLHLKAPEDAYGVDFKDHAAWASVRGKSNNKQATHLYRSLDFKTWEVNATYLGEQGRAVVIRHLDGKRYFLVSSASFFHLQNKFSPYALADINEKGFLTIKELVDLDLKEPLIIPSPQVDLDKTIKGEFNKKYSALMAMLFGNSWVRYPGGMALVARRPGYLWFFDDQSGALKRSVKLFSGVTEEKLGPPHQLDWAILGCQPRINGHLLVASRDEAAVLSAMDAYPTKKNLKYLEDEAQQKINLEQDQMSLNRWPTIRWWDIDPSTGTITEEQPPQNVPDRIWDLKVFQNFRFRFKPDGNLLVN